MPGAGRSGGTGVSVQQVLEVQFRKMKRALVMAAQQCECSECLRTLHLKVVKMVNSVWFWFWFCFVLFVCFVFFKKIYLFY